MRTDIPTLGQMLQPMDQPERASAVTAVRHDEKTDTYYVRITKGYEDGLHWYDEDEMEAA
ncbi:hypothetical protein [Methyloceanibacter caenitepidi]|nr:hypothetical protein [Methyloceanibacter caenitepidi]